MAKFMALFTGKPGASRPDEATVAKGMQAWGAWMARYADRLVDTGGPLGKTKKVSSGGIADIQNNLGGYVVVEAEDHEAAARMFEGHPHLGIPQASIEVMEVRSMGGG